jgi:hypothetical protein
MSDAPKETKPMQSISNETVCLYFYYVFLVVAIMAGLTVAADLYIALGKPRVGLGLLLRSAPVLILSVVNALFMYILCTRTLLK